MPIRRIREGWCDPFSFYLFVVSYVITIHVLQLHRQSDDHQNETSIEHIFVSHDHNNQSAHDVSHDHHNQSIHGALYVKEGHVMDDIQMVTTVPRQKTLEHSIFSQIETVPHIPKINANKSEIIYEYPNKPHMKVTRYNSTTPRPKSGVEETPYMKIWKKKKLFETEKEHEDANIKVFVFHPSTTMEREFFRKSETKVNSFRYGFVIDGSTICDNETFMGILVHTSPLNTDRREAIRNTWGSITNAGQEWPNRKITKKLRLGFISGVSNETRWNEQLKKESSLYHDIVQGNFTDTYFNMTWKSMLGLKWVFSYCQSAQYFLKSDDDMIINFPYILKLLEKKHMERGIMGPLSIRGPVLRGGGKWGVAKELFPFKFYPPFEVGSAYIMTTDIVKELFHTAEYVRPFHVDDAYLTGVIGAIIGLRHYKQKGWAFSGSRKPETCDVLLDFIVTGHKMTPKRLLDIWDAMKTFTPRTCAIMKLGNG